jgi:hypothetical protein
MMLAVIVTAGIGSGSLWAQGSGKKLYKWVDEKGNVFYSDKVPPDQIKHGRKELNQQGIITGRQEAALSEAERAQKRQQEAEARRKAAEAARKAEEDKRFLDSYATEDDLHRAFQLNLDLLGQQIAAAKNDVDLRQKSLDRLMGRAGERRAISQQTNYLASKEQEKKLAETDYQTKLKRYRDLAQERRAAADPAKPGD